jgi:hypothetical protein
METEYLLPLTMVALVLAVGTLAFRARSGRGYGPFAAGLVAAALLFAGKFVLDSHVAMYGGVAALIGASIWNSWPKKPTTSVPSAPDGTLLQIGSIKKEK